MINGTNWPLARSATRQAAAAKCSGAESLIDRLKRKNREREQLWGADNNWSSSGAQSARLSASKAHHQSLEARARLLSVALHLSASRHDFNHAEAEAQ